MALKTLIENRARYKEELKKVRSGSSEYSHYNALSQAAKIVANSFYGVLLCKQYRYFSALAGHAVTSTGQWLIKTVADHFEGLGRGWKIVGGDTDSVFVHTVRPTITPRGSDELLAPEGRVLRDEIERINAKWPKLLARYGVKESFISLEWEMTLARWLGVRKKCYAGTADYVDGKRTKTPWVHKYRGLAVRRGDRSAIAKRMQLEVLEAVLGKADVEELPPIPTTDGMRLLVDTWRERLLSSPLSVEDVVLRQGIRKPVRAYRSEAAFTSKTCKGCKYRFESQSWPDITTCPTCGTERARRRPPAHVLIAEEMSRGGESPLVGDKISYVYVYDPAVKGDGWIPVRVDDADLNKLDRVQYWYSTYSPAHTVLTVSHPDGEWIDPKKERVQLYAEKRREHNRAVAGSGGLFDLISDPGSIFSL
jgi:DNA polymerase elongation subunit (family B)